MFTKSKVTKENRLKNGIYTRDFLRNLFIYGLFQIIICILLWIIRFFVNCHAIWGWLCEIAPSCNIRRPDNNNYILTHYPAHSDQVSLRDPPQTPQTWVRGRQCCAPAPQRSEDHDICHHECKAVRTQQHGWQCIPDYQPNILLLQSWVCV